MENSIRRFLDVVTTPGRSRIVGLLVLVILVAAIPLTVFVAQQQQEIRQRAEECSCGSHEDCTHNNDDGTCAETVTVCNSCDNGNNGGNNGNNDNGNNNGSDGSSGGSDRSSDGQSLSSQSPTTQRDFRSKYCGDANKDCPEARRAWVREHEDDLSRSTDNNPNNDRPSGECSEGEYKRMCTGQRESCGSSAGEAEIYRCESGKWIRKNNECRSECSSGRGGYFKEGQTPGSDTAQSLQQSQERSTSSNPPAQNPSGGYCYGTQWCYEDTGNCSQDSRCETGRTQRCLYTDLKRGNNICYFGECNDPNNCGFNKDCTPNEANFGVATYCPGQAPTDFARNDPAKLFNFCRQSISYKSNQKVCDVNGDGKYDEEDLKVLQAKVPTPTPIPVRPPLTSRAEGGPRTNTSSPSQTGGNSNTPCKEGETGFPSAKSGACKQGHPCFDDQVCTNGQWITSSEHCESTWSCTDPSRVPNVDCIKTRTQKGCGPSRQQDCIYDSCTNNQTCGECHWFFQNDPTPTPDPNRTTQVCQWDSHQNAMAPGCIPVIQHKWCHTNSCTGETYCDPGCSWPGN